MYETLKILQEKITNFNEVTTLNCYSKKINLILFKRGERKHKEIADGIYGCHLRLR